MENSAPVIAPSAPWSSVPSHAAETDDLNTLATTRACRAARLLAGHFHALDIDGLNRSLRADYPHSPLLFDSREQIERDLAALANTRLSAERVALARCLFLGQSVHRGDFEKNFGPHAADLIQECVGLGLFISDGRLIATNHLLLATHRIRNSDVLYLFADIPPYLHTAGLRRQRVYLGRDSYFLNCAVQSLTGNAETIVEYGSGSGIQLITFLALQPEAAQGIGIEIDTRARNVSVFNAALNGVDARFAVIPNIECLPSFLAGRPVQLAFSNPPFLAAPREFPVPGLREPFPLADVFSRAGWGDEDGLCHTDSFLRRITPHLDANGTVLIYSQFAGSDTAPTALNTISAIRDLQLRRFLHFPRGNYNAQHDISATDWGRALCSILAFEQPFLEAAVFDALEKSAAEIFARKNISRFHSGVFIGAKSARGILPNLQALEALEAGLLLDQAGAATPAPLLHE